MAPSTTDAAVVAVAERLGVTEITTLARWHFHAVGPATRTASQSFQN
jgi:predicted nucleic acid-binding protein